MCRTLEPLVEAIGYQGKVRWHGHGLRADGQHQAAKSISSKRVTTRQALEGDDGKRPNVRAVIDLPSPRRLLGTHVLGRAHDRSRERDRRCAQIDVQRFGNAKIQEFDDHVVGVFGKKDVSRFQVAVNDAAAVRPCRGSCHLPENCAGFTRRNQPILAQLLRERLASQQLHGDVRRVIIHTKIENLYDVGAPNRRCRLRFAPESSQCLGRIRDARFQQFDRGRAAEFDVLGAPDRAHTSGCQLVDQPIFARQDAAFIHGFRRHSPSISGRPGPLLKSERDCSSKRAGIGIRG